MESWLGGERLKGAHHFNASAPSGNHTHTRTLRGLRVRESSTWGHWKITCNIKGGVARGLISA